MCLLFHWKSITFAVQNSSYAIQWWGTRLWVSISPHPPGRQIDVYSVCLLVILNLWSISCCYFAKLHKPIYSLLQALLFDFAFLCKKFCEKVATCIASCRATISWGFSYRGKSSCWFSNLIWITPIAYSSSLFLQGQRYKNQPLGISYIVTNH